MLRPGPVTLWPPAPGRPPLRVVPRDASSASDRGPFWWAADSDSDSGSAFADVCVERVAEAESTGADPPCWRVPVLAEAPLPPDTDPAEVAGVLADAVTGGLLTMQADVGHASAEPRLAGSPLEGPTARFFVHLVVGYRTEPEPARVFAHLDLLWSCAWKQRYGGRGPVFVPTSVDRLTHGFAATEVRRSAGAL